jgi:hypothetical protein
VAVRADQASDDKGERSSEIYSLRRGREERGERIWVWLSFVVKRISADTKLGQL